MRKRLGFWLIAIGALLLCGSLGFLLLARPAAPASPPAARPGTREPPLPTGARPTLLLGPFAAAVATLLPPPTPIPPAGAPAGRPSASARIVIPAVGIDATVVEVGWHVEWVDGEARGVWDTVAGAAGHHRGSADPGQVGNCVLSGHSSEAGGAVFLRLAELRPGDSVNLVTFDGRVYNYEIEDVVTLDEVGASEAEKRENARWLDPTDSPSVTLVTCWPAWSYTHRVIVRGELRAP